MSTKNKNIEEIYQKKTPVEHILIRPDTYIGSTSMDTQQMWVWDDETKLIIKKPVSFCPGLYKIFDEILVNAADNKHRDPSMTTIKIDIDLITNSIEIYNDGKGIPIVIHKDEKVYVPTMIFGHLLTSSNFDDTEKKVTGGRNGFGAKLCNIFSNKFIVETASKDQKKKFVQKWENNMANANSPDITEFKGLDYTRVTFIPDLKRFGMAELDNDFVSLLKRRAYDLAGTIPGVKVYLNGSLISVNTFEHYAALYNRKEPDIETPSPSLYKRVNDRWEICVTPSDGAFQHVSFVNNIATTKGGSHVNHVCNKLIARLIDDAHKKDKTIKSEVRPQHVKQHFWVFINCKINNPSFDSQTKENLTLNEKEFGSSCDFSEKYLKEISEIITPNVLSWFKFKQKTDLHKKGVSSKRARLYGMEKLDDANDAGTADSMKCTLILTEGDSAKSLAVSGVSVVGRDKYGVFPLRGKILNIRETPAKILASNKEVESLVKIIGLDYKNSYTDFSSLSKLRYGKVMFMTDQDYDGSHIKGLLINFFHCLWPNLIKHDFLCQFITPIIKVTNNEQKSQVKAFFSIPEFEEWQKSTANYKSWSVKYYKGLGTSKDTEVKEYFQDLPKHKIKFEYSGNPCDEAIVLAFSKLRADSRKRWLDNFQDEHTRRQEFGLPQVYLYQKGTEKVSYCDFVNKELILFSHADNIRSIPSVIDGLKPGQRKVIFTCLHKNVKKDTKVFQLAGSVSEVAAYHHGEQSLTSTIINLAQNFLGSNNINLLMPEGQFGTRLKGGKDHAAARYIFTRLSLITRYLFLSSDDPLLNYVWEDNQRVEPNWYCPIIPMVLVNGSDGIGTGYATKIPNYNPLEIIKNIKKMINGEEPDAMIPYYKNFTGSITELSPDRFMVAGRAYYGDKDTVVVSELPIRVWTQTYKESVLEPLVKTDASNVNYVLQDYKDHHDVETINYILKFKPGYLDDKDDAFISHLLKLHTTIQTNQLVLFDASGRVHRYATVIDILKDFFKVRLAKYVHRKNYMVTLLNAEFLKLFHQERFIHEIIQNIFTINNKTKVQMIQIIKANNYPSDPVKAFYKNENANAPSDDTDKAENVEDNDTGYEDYDYLVGMPLSSLTLEKQETLRKKKDDKNAELLTLQKQTPEELWLIDLEILLKKLEECEKKEITEKLAVQKKSTSKKIKMPVKIRELDCTILQEGKKIPSMANINGEDNGIQGDDPLTGTAPNKPPKSSTKKPQTNGAATDIDKKRIRKAPVKKNKEKTTKAPETKPKKRALAPKATEETKQKKTKLSKPKSDDEISLSPPPPRKLESRSTKAKPKKYQYSDNEDTLHDDTDIYVVSDDD